MEIKIVTDSEHRMKVTAIHNAFVEKFPEDTIQLISVRGGNFETPITRDNIEMTLRRRFQRMYTDQNRDTDDILAAIQKGYYESNGLWYLSAAVGIVYPSGEIVSTLCASVPIEERYGAEKTTDYTKSLGQIIEAHHPEWNRNTESVYEFLTGESEIAWLQQSLRHCLKKTPKHL